MVFVQTDVEHLRHMGQWLADRKLTVTKDHVYPYEEAKEAFARLRTGHTRGKIVVLGPAETE